MCATSMYLCSVVRITWILSKRDTPGEAKSTVETNTNKNKIMPFPTSKDHFSRYVRPHSTNPPPAPWQRMATLGHHKALIEPVQWTCQLLECTLLKSYQVATVSAPVHSSWHSYWFTTCSIRFWVATLNPISNYTQLFYGGQVTMEW